MLKLLIILLHKTYYHLNNIINKYINYFFNYLTHQFIKFIKQHL